MPGVGSLSQSTICRFESLTLSHNNMVALKPILHSWLEKAEEAMKQKDTIGDINGILPNTDKKRKRTSIAAPEKRELEQFFKWGTLLNSVVLILFSDNNQDLLERELLRLLIDWIWKRTLWGCGFVIRDRNRRGEDWIKIFFSDVRFFLVVEPLKA